MFKYKNLNNKMLKNKSHIIMILVFVLILVISFPVKASYFDYTDFNWDEFYKKNINYWNDTCKKEGETDGCDEVTLKAQKNFYVSLYKMLAEYEADGYHINDNIIIGTVFYMLDPMYANDKVSDDAPVSDKDVNNYYEPSYVVVNGDSINSQKDENGETVIPDADVELNDYADIKRSDSDTANTLADYYDNERNTLKTLLKNMIAYRTHCYKKLNKVTITKDDGSTETTCPEGSYETDVYIAEDQLTGFGTVIRDIDIFFNDANNLKFSYSKFCAQELEGNGGYELGFTYYHTGRLLHDSKRKINAKFYDEEFDDPYYDNCVSQGGYYTYLSSNGDVDQSVSTDKYFDFLKTSKYFDNKAQLQSYYTDNILKPENVDCLTSDVCNNSLEAKVGTDGYQNYEEDLEKDRLDIIYDIIDYLNNYGVAVSYDGHGTADYTSVETQDTNYRSYYYWPIGSNETREENGITYADGTPTKTPDAVIRRFGETYDPIDQKKEMHYGIDISGEDGVTNVINVYKGTVISIKNDCTVSDYECNEGYGNEVVVQTDNGDYVIYAHLASIDDAIIPGAQVVQGELLGKLGATGKVLEPCLHYEIRIGSNSVDNAIDPLQSTGAGKWEESKESTSLRPQSSYLFSGLSGKSTKFSGTSLTKEEYVSKVNSYCNSSQTSGKLASYICSNAGAYYDSAKKYDVNPEFVITRAIVEGNSPGGNTHNYWGINCTNTGGASACYSFSGVDDGVKSLASTINKYNTIGDAMSKYAYIGNCWAKGSWSAGGCIYYPYIKQYLSDSRASYVGEVCDYENSSGAHTMSCGVGSDGKPAVKTTQEDQDAYTQYQCDQKMNPINGNIFS